MRETAIGEVLIFAIVTQLRRNYLKSEIKIRSPLAGAMRERKFFAIV